MRHIGAFLACSFGACLAAGATVFTVSPDGSGDFPVIQQAVNAAVSGDIIELENGMFLGGGNRDIRINEKAITIRSRSGNAEDCILDCQGSAGDLHTGFLIDVWTAHLVIIENLTITNGFWHEGGGLRLAHGGLNVSGCVFRDNRCVFGGGAVELDANSVSRFYRCSFVGNSADYGGALCIWAAHTALVECTFYGNAARLGGAVFDNSNIRSTIENCMIGFSSEGSGVHCAVEPPDIICCDIFGNAGGDWIDCIADLLGLNGNICMDPLLCAPEEGDLHLECVSPCAPEHNPECGLIGAWWVGCGASPGNESTWGGVKVKFGKEKAR